jgi:two-component system CheB/CheR fusion protein
LNEELSTVNVQLEDKLKELEQANNDLTNLLSSTSIATLFLDRQFRIKGFTPALTRLIHVIASDINRPISHIAGPFAGAELTESAQSVLDDLAAHEREVSADPNHHYLRRILPYRTEDERIEGVVVTFTDITELKRGAEQARRLAAVVRDSNDAILVCDFEGRILSWNRGAEEMYGYTEQEALRLNMAAMIPDSARARHDEWLDRARRSEPAQPTKTQRIAKDGKIVDILFTLSVLRDSAGMPTAIASTERDITHQLITEKELRTRAERLLEADRRKDEFLAMLAHELRNPLAPIRNAVEALGQPRLLDDKANLEVSRKLIERQVKHLSRLVDDLLDVSRITRGQVSLQQEKIELGSLVERAVELNREQIESRQHRLSISVPAEPIWLEGDATRITQVLGNLLNNAAKYTDPGGAISVSVSVENRQGVFRVRDTGMGIAADLLPHVFDLFVQGKRSLDRSQGGLGIGLRLVRQLVEMHGGTVAARSDGPGYGSEFEVRLPIDQQARAATISKRFDVPPPLPLIPAKGLRALVVDDNPDTVESMSALLGMHGHEVRTASDGELAVQVAKDFQPEAVLLDIGLPGIDGYEVARRLRDIPATHNALLLAVTGYGTPEDRRASQDAGFDYHLVKPVDPGSILGLLRAHAQRT